MTRKPRQDFSVSKVRFFSLLWLSVGHSKKGKWALLLHSNRDMWQSLNKIMEKRENPFYFFLKPKSFSLSSLSQSRNSEAFSLPLSRSFLLLHSPLKLQAKLQPLATISAPNRERRAFLES